MVSENRFSGLTISQNGPVAYGVPVTVSATIAVGNASSIVWDLGDGNSATGLVATHLYAAPGVYTVGRDEDCNSNTFGDRDRDAVLSCVTQHAADELWFEYEIRKVTTGRDPNVSDLATPVQPDRYDASRVQTILMSECSQPNHPTP